MSQKIAVVSEARADFETATDLADRVICECIDWIREDPDTQLPLQREWVSGVAGETFHWKRIKRAALDAGVTIAGHFDGEPGQADAQAARRAIQYLIENVPELAGIVLVRDLDDQPERRDGLGQARRLFESNLPIAIGCATVERESWALCGFVPETDAELARLAAETDRLKFDPTQFPERLTHHKADTAEKSPKRALAELTAGSSVREQACWAASPLDHLRTRGANNGLADYLEEIEKRLARLFGRVPP